MKRLESKFVDPSEIITYWMKLGIAAFFGMITYYLLTYLPPLAFLEGEWGLALSFFLYVGIFLICLILVPVIYRVINKNEALLSALKNTLIKDVVPPSALYIFLCTLNFVLNMG